MKPSTPGIRFTYAIYTNLKPRSFPNCMSSEPLHIELTNLTEPRGRILQLRGPLVLGNLRPFRTELRKDDTHLTILELSGVPFMDSTCLGEIVNFYSRSQGNGARFILVAPSPRVAALLQVTRIDSLLTVVSTLKDALPTTHQSPPLE
jgi:anti-sigma B factor antagonist